MLLQERKMALTKLNNLDFKLSASRTRGEPVAVTGESQILAGDSIKPKSINAKGNTVLRTGTTGKSVSSQDEVRDTLWTRLLTSEIRSTHSVHSLTWMMEKLELFFFINPQPVVTGFEELILGKALEEQISSVNEKEMKSSEAHGPVS
ncbi:hypothetical protein STEG23_001486 [Scotinomys teguina]